MATNTRPPIRKTSEQKRKYNKYYKAISKNWKRNFEKLIEIVQGSLLSNENHVVEKMEMLMLGERFLQFYTKQLRDSNHEKYNVLTDWITRNKIQHIGQVYFWMEKTNIEKKYWLTEKLKLGFFKNILAQRTHFLENGFPKAKSTKAQIEIRASLTNGQFPDYNKFSHQEIASILGEVLFVDYLEKEIMYIKSADSLTSGNLIIYSSIGNPESSEPGKITGEEAISIKIPIDVIKNLQKGFVKKELEKIRNIHPRPVHELKLYTRKEAAEFLSISLPKLDELTKEGKLKASRIGGDGDKRFRWEDLQEVLVGVKPVSGRQFNT